MSTPKPTGGAGRAPRWSQALRLLGVGALTLAIIGITARQQSTPAAAAAPALCAVDTSGIVGWWRGEGNQTSVIGPGLAGTAFYSGGVAGQGFSLDRTASLSAAGVAPVTDAVSVEMWVRLTNLTPVAAQTLLSRWDFPSADDAARSFSLDLDADGQLDWWTDDNGPRVPESLRAPAPALFDGLFHHVVATWDATSFVVYFDGVPIATKPSQGGPLNAATTIPVRVGSQGGRGAPPSFTGVIDEPTIWNRALTAAEVATIHTAGVSGKCTFPPTQQAKLLASNGAANDRLGASVAVDGPTMVVGAPFSSARTFFGGEAVVYQFNGVNWVQQAILTAADGANVDFFGGGVAVSGDTIAVGSYGNNGGGTDSGAVYIFTRTGSTWSQQAKLLAADAAPGDFLGKSVALSGDTLVAGAPLKSTSAIGDGAAYVFTRTGTSWTQQAKLVASVPAGNASFGQSVAISGDTVVAGRPGQGSGSSATGDASVFTRLGTIWSLEAQLVGADSAAGDAFGSAVAITGDTVAIGATLDDHGGLDSGSAYVFGRVGTTWTQTTKLLAADAGANHHLGAAIALQGAKLVVGSPLDPIVGTDSGSAYVFGNGAAGWVQVGKLVPVDSVVGDMFGQSVAVSSSTVLVGAWLTDDRGSNSGSTYVFTG